MKIMFDHQIFNGQQYGGISRYFHEIANQLVSIKGQEVEIFAPLYINAYFSDGDKVKPHGIKIPRLPRTGRIIAMINSILSRFWVRPRHDVDIYHETYYSRMDNCPSSAKRILTVYDMIHEKISDYFPITDSTSRAKALSVERADHIICISEQTRQDLIELFDVAHAKTSVVHLGFKLTSRGETEYKVVLPRRPFLLYVGSRIRYKNFEGLLQAYSASPQLKKKFDLVCFGGGEFVTTEKNLLKRLGISMESVHHISGDDDILNRYYSLASAFIYPSLYEGFGIPPLEAMSFDCPVVCSRVSSIPEVVGNAGEMFDPHEPESIRMAIERVVNDDTLRQTLISRGRERIKLFSWKRCAEETLAVYRSVLS